MHRSRWSIVALVLALFASEAGAQAPTIEYDVKAAFLLNFSRFIEWPGSMRGQSFRLCTMEPDPFGSRLQAATTGETWEGRAIEVTRLTSLRDANCHLLYVPAAAMTRFRAYQRALAGQPVLLVGETRDFLANGGMIRLFVEANRVRFSISQRACEAVGLRVSSRLLRLAREVVPSERSE
jgi:hypothetical protein